MQSTQALAVAEGGIEKAMYQFSTGTGCNALAYANALGATGNFITGGTQYDPFPSTTLSAAVSNAATVIPVVSAVAYAPQGRIIIESEVIEYTYHYRKQFHGCAARCRRDRGGGARERTTGSAESLSYPVHRHCGECGTGG